MSCRRVFVGLSKPAARILNRTTEDVADMRCDMCLDVVRNPEWSSLVMKRVGSQSSAVDVENEREWTRATCDRDTLQMLLLRETPCLP